MAKRKIVWSHKAKIKLFAILDFYNDRNKSTTYSRKLYKKLNHELLLLTEQPDIGIKTDFEFIRGLVVEDFILFYEVTTDQVIVHLIWDSRQDPINLKIP